MTLNELKIDILKKLVQGDEEIDSTNFQRDFDGSTLGDYSNDEVYGAFLANMNSAINTSTRYLVVAGRVPFKSYSMPKTGYTKEIDTSSNGFPTDIYKIVAVLFEDDNGYRSTIGYYKIGNKICFNSSYFNGKFTIVYEPIIDIITEETSEDIELSELNINPVMEQFIIWNSASELYNKIDSSQAREWKNNAETYLTALDNTFDAPSQNKVRRIF